MRGKGRMVVCVGLGVAVLVGCGRWSRDSEASAGGDSGSEPTASGGSMEAGAQGAGDGGANAGQTSSGGKAGSGGTGGDAGTGTGGDSAASAGLAATAGSSAGHGGLGGASGEPGFVCGAYDHTSPDVTCAIDEVCVLCAETEAIRPVHCAPHPVANPAEYGAFLATC